MKKLTALVLTLTLCLALVSGVVSAADERDLSQAEAFAAELKNLGVFQGVSDTDFALGRAPTRVEALVMLIRVLGKEKAAIGGTWSHPFTDVPDWADKYVGYGYTNGLTKGSSETEFGTGNADATTFLTFMLRALGYTDVDGEDFTWDNPYPLAQQIRLLTSGVSVAEFLRADVVIIAHTAMTIYLKGTTQTLAESLIEAGVFTKNAYTTHYKAAIDYEALFADYTRQEAAFELLKAWIITYGEYDSDMECMDYTVPADLVETGMFYDEEEEYISAYMHVYIPGDNPDEIESIASIDIYLEPGDDVVDCSYSYYVYDEKTDGFVEESYGIKSVKPAEYSRDGLLVFDECQGSDTEQDMVLAKKMYNNVLLFVDILLQQMDFAGSYTIKDFGYNI